MSGEHQLYYVVTAPPAATDRAAAACLAAALRIAPYDARLKLAAPTPQILSALPNRSDAVELQMALDAVGVRTRCLTHVQIVHSPPLFPAIDCRMVDESVVFLCREEDVLAVADKDARVLVKARVRRRTETHVDGSRRGAMWSSSRGESSHTVDTSFRLYLYVAGPRVFEIAQHEFNYDFLGGGKSMSSLRNFATLVTLLRKRFPDAAFDESLCRAAGSFDKVGDSYVTSHGAAAGIKREHRCSFTDERFVREAAWLIALTLSAGEW